MQDILERLEVPFIGLEPTLQEEMWNFYFECSFWDGNLDKEA